jgi:hypothetical protein
MIPPPTMTIREWSGNFISAGRPVITHYGNKKIATIIPIGVFHVGQPPSLSKDGPESVPVLNQPIEPGSCC